MNVSFVFSLSRVHFAFCSLFTFARFFALPRADIFQATRGRFARELVQSCRRRVVTFHETHKLSAKPANFLTRSHPTAAAQSNACGTHASGQIKKPCAVFRADRRRRPESKKQNNCKAKQPPMGGHETNLRRHALQTEAINAPGLCASRARRGLRKLSGHMRYQ